MHDGQAFDFGVGFRSQGDWAGGPVFRCGLPFRGDGRPTRDAGFGAQSRVQIMGGIRIEVRWLPEVSWQKRIRFSTCK